MSKSPDPHHWPAEGLPARANMFFGLYFMMTGLHGLHVLIGMSILGWVLWRNLKGDFSPRYFTAVDIGALYWHLVDLVWIYLFPLLYLIG
jgi:cytochrome c oxidase subunit 3